MIYNLVSYLTTQIPSLSFFADGFNPTSPDTAIAVVETGGTEAPWFNRQDRLVQFISRAKSRFTARENAETVYNNIKKKYGVELPAVTVGGIPRPKVKTWGIVPVNIPQYVADDENGCPLFTFTVMITTTI